MVLSGLSGRSVEAGAQATRTIDSHTTSTTDVAAAEQPGGRILLSTTEAAHPARAEVGLAESILHELPDPDALGELRHLFEDDPSYHYLLAAPGLKQVVDEHLDLITGPLPAGRSGVRCAAEVIASLRAVILEGYAALPFYRMEFTRQRLELPSVPPAPERFRMDLDFSAARTILDIVSHPDLSASEIEARLQGDVFRAFANHRNQDFYPVRLTHDMLARNLQRAASDAPIDRLYRYAFPVGLMHFAEVRDRLSEYGQLVALLENDEQRITAAVAADLQPYLPADLTFDRTVHFVFGDGADGWVSNGIAAVDLEFFKDDFDALLPLLAHETFHALQSEVRREGESFDDPRHREFAGILETIYQEGTANFVAPAQRKPAAEARALAAEGLEMLEQIREGLYGAETNDDVVRDLRNRGVQGAGPFYWLGAEMSRVIVEQSGHSGIMRAMEDGGVSFFTIYLDATGGSSRFSEELEAAVRGLER